MLSTGGWLTPTIQSVRSRTPTSSEPSRPSSRCAVLAWATVRLLSSVRILASLVVVSFGTPRLSARFVSGMDQLQSHRHHLFSLQHNQPFPTVFPHKHKRESVGILFFVSICLCLIHESARGNALPPLDLDPKGIAASNVWINTYPTGVSALPLASQWTAIWTTSRSPRLPLSLCILPKRHLIELVDWYVRLAPRRHLWCCMSCHQT